MTHDADPPGLDGAALGGGRARRSGGCSGSSSCSSIGAALAARRPASPGRRRRLRRPRVDVHRWIRPSVLTAGDVGRVEVLVAAASAAAAHRRSSWSSRSAPTARRGWPSPRSAADAEVSAGYRIPTERRGVLTIGPLTAVRHDVLGLARSVTEVAGIEEVLVSPRAHLLDMPTLGQGVLGRHLLALAQRLGPGDFHSLRDYVDGDEPRTIHWRASARSEELKVRQHTRRGPAPLPRRCSTSTSPPATPATRRSSGR